MASIGIIDYGMGNLHSAAKALEAAAPKACVVVSDDHHTLSNCDRLVLPGVGSLGHCFAALSASGLDQLVRDNAGIKPMLGICVGMQLLCSRGEENGGTPCLELMPGSVERFPDSPGFCVPHMGWNTVEQRPHPLWKGIANNERFYFVHSYHAVMADSEQVMATTHHGISVTAAIAMPKLFAVQFHPEKSQKAGLQLLSNFACWDGEQA